MDARDCLAVALDVARLDEAENLLSTLSGVPGWIKVGAELFTAVGPAALVAAARGSRVFLDTKIHDIPNTAARAAAAAALLGVGMLTLHAAGGSAMLRAARDAAHEAAAAVGGEPPALVAVTVLTSFSSDTLESVGVSGQLDAQVLRLAELAREAGLDGVVASVREAELLRTRLGADLRIVTPGIRPAGFVSDDQMRTAAAAEAIAAGSDLLVVGRPVLSAEDPAQAARDLVREIERARAARSA